MDQQYQYNNPETVTFIDQLPDIETLEGMNNNGMGSYMENNQYNSAYDRPVMPPSQQQLQSKLKHPHMAPPESGMSIMKPVHPVNQNVVNTPALSHNQMQQMPPHMQYQHPQQHQQHQQYQRHQQHQQIPQQMHEEQHQEHFDQTPNSYKPSCLEVAEHIKDCPICSKLYNNNDNTVYIIVIVILSIICILLLKRVLDI